jgi:hypothetical protein
VPMTAGFGRRRKSMMRPVGASRASPKPRGAGSHRGWRAQGATVSTRGPHLAREVHVVSTRTARGRRHGESENTSRREPCRPFTCQSRPGLWPPPFSR